MCDFIELPVSAIITESCTTEEGLCNTKYIVYLNMENPTKKVRVNTYYIKENDVVKLCKYYDRGLCNTIEEFEKLDIDFIEDQAYGSWMDGAR